MNIKLFRWGRIAWWLEIYARKPKVLGSSLAATYVQRWAPHTNRPANVSVSVKREEVVVRSSRNAIHFPSSPVVVNGSERKPRKKRCLIFLFISFTVDKKLQIWNLKGKTQSDIPDSWEKLASLSQLKTDQCLTDRHY